LETEDSIDSRYEFEFYLLLRAFFETEVLGRAVELVKVIEFILNDKAL